MLEHSEARFDFSQAVQAGNLPSHFTFAARQREQAATGLLTRSNGVSRTITVAGCTVVDEQGQTTRSRARVNWAGADRARRDWALGREG